MIAPIIFSAIYALICAAGDARAIRLGNTIRHGMQWAIRAAVTVVAMILYWLASERGLWHCVVLAVACGTLFSIVFRWAMNLMRGKPWWYMGARLEYRDENGSRIDGAWHWIARKVGGDAYPSELPAKLAYGAELVAGAALFPIAALTP